MSNTTSYQMIPPEITEKVLLKLPINQIKQLCSVDTQAYQICSNDSFWRMLVKRDFGIDTYKNTDSYKCLYQLLSSNIFIVTIVRTYYEEDENEDDMRPHSSSSIFLTLKEAMEYAIDRLENSEFLGIRNFAIPDIDDFDPQFMQDILNDNLDTFRDDPDKLDQLSTFRKNMIDKINAAAIENIIYNEDHRFVIDIIAGYINSITIEMNKIQVEKDLELKYDMIATFYKADRGGIHIDRISIPKIVNKISKSTIPVKVKDDWVLYEDWYSREVRFLDKKVNMKFIELVKEKFNAMIV